MSDKKYSDDDIARLGAVIAENILEKMQPAVEAIEEIKKQTSKISLLQEEISGLKCDVKILKAAVTDTSHELNQQVERVTRLEAA